ncbi:MAG: phosphodiester glycosidase family protein [Patescibacteria group bacterium]|jgi:hypothetical protein
MRKACFFIIALAFLASFVGAVLLLRSRLPDGVERRVTAINDRKVAFDLINLTAGGYTFENVLDSTSPKSVQSWRENLGADIVFNSAYFNGANEPTGYYALPASPSITPWPSVKEQADTASYSFLVQIVEGKLRLGYLPSSPTTEAPMNAFLSFPTLLADGQVLVKSDSGSLASRTMLAQDPRGNIFLIVTEKAPLSLFESAQWLSQQPEHFILAGNLDGGPSTGLSITDGKHVLNEPSAPIPNVIAGSR